MMVGAEPRDSRPRPPQPLRTVAAATFVRCLTLQASWNEQRLQNLGLLAALAPWLARQGFTRRQLRGICRRYYGYFNTNPYLAGYIVGGLLHQEEARRRGEPVTERQVGRLRDTLARACGALGDQIFWMGLRPALMLAACLAAVAGAWPAALALIGIFAVLQLRWRWRSLQEGLARGDGVSEVIGGAAWHRTIAWARRTVLILTGVLLGLYFAGIDGSGETVGAGRMLGLFVLGMGLPFLVRQQMPAELQLLLGLGCVGLLVLVPA
jgi:mannose/fructose/N-acetylgalactosamine-specific phosphotransferase system component IID